MELEVFASEISKRFGNVKRARGCFLYTEKGVRLTDLFQEGGRAILGWGGNSAFTVLKNVLSRGLTGSFPTVFDLQLKKAVSELLDSRRSVSVFFDREKAVSAETLVSSANAAHVPPRAIAEHTITHAVLRNIFFMIPP